jgi:hypothetical protein
MVSAGKRKTDVGIRGGLGNVNKKMTRMRIVTSPIKQPSMQGIYTAIRKPQKQWERGGGRTFFGLKLFMGRLLK